MNETSVLISGIEYKLKKVLDKYNTYKSLNQNLVEENQNLKQNIENNNILIKQLKEELAKIKIAKSLMSEGKSKDARLKINGLVREIDKCIGLLNQ